MFLTEKGWRRSTECYLEVLTDISNVITSPIILPPPRSWGVSSFELAALEKFYREVLQIGDGSLDAVLKEFDKMPNFHHSKQLCEVLGKTWRKLAVNDLKRLRAYFKGNECIILSEDDKKRYSLDECVWAPKLKYPENLYDHFPDLDLFFTWIMEVPETDIGRVSDELVNFASLKPNIGESKEEPAIRLLVALSQDVEKYGRYLNKEKLLESEIFPLVGDGCLPKMCSASANFYIMDREDYQTKFRHKLPVLDIDHTTFWLLQPFFV
ncbi:hypothetical protein FACUT_8674 [Fusarium acutatum]|uniref:Uncharacterized protein n=1 Tax=Fusarium acutatum TaxID=78861 RepID=A0A8H4JJ03_9HYPO|nr:hypothetical protein FACUT_8674 [Fusarium acutatum]